MTAYYNEIDPFAAAWLRELITAGHIAPGDVDERSIEDVLPSDIMGYTQCHFFAGVGVWSYALRQAGWPDDSPVWTGSCPCQPFSAAGKGAGFVDERHLWPDFHHLISVCRPPVVFGEQVASKDGLAWFDLVHADMEGAGYACGAVDTCAAGFGAPHIRQRLYWVAHTDVCSEYKGMSQPVLGEVKGHSAVGGLAHSPNRGKRSCVNKQDGNTGEHRTDCGTGGMEHPSGNGRPQGRNCDREHDWVQSCATFDTCKRENPSPTNGFWSAADWLGCRDGKWRPVEPGTFPLANGATNRVGRLRGYGNAIVAPQAEAFIRAYISIRSLAHDITRPTNS